MSAVIELTTSKIKINYSTDLGAPASDNNSFSAFKASVILGYQAVSTPEGSVFQILFSGRTIEINYAAIPEVSILGVTKTKDQDYSSAEELKDLFEATL